MSTSRSDPGRSPAVRRAARVLTLLSGEASGLTASDLSRRLGVPKSSLGDLIGTLAEQRMVTRSADGRVLLGPAVGQIARGFTGGSALLDDFDAECARYSAIDDHVALVATLVGLDVTYLAVRGSTGPLPLTLRAGIRLPAWATATGVALLTTLDDEEIERLHRHDPPTTPEGLSPDIESLMASVSEARSRGFAGDDGLGSVELSGVAALVPGVAPALAVGLIPRTSSDEKARARDERLVRALAAHLGAAGGA